MQHFSKTSSRKFLYTVFFSCLFLQTFAVGQGKQNAPSVSDLKTPMVTICKNQALSATSSGELVLANLKLTDALRVRDLSAALASSELALEMAMEFGDPNLIVLASLEQAVIQAECGGRKNIGPRLNSTEFTLNENATPEMQLYFGLAKLNLEIGSETPSPDYPELLDFIATAALGCKDQNLLCRRCSTELFFRLVHLGHPLNHPVVAKLRKQLDTFNFKVDHPDSKIVLKLIEGRELKRAKSYLAELECYEEAIAIAQDMGNLELKWRFEVNKGMLLKKLDRMDEAIDSLDDCLLTGLRLKSPSVLLHAHQMKALLFSFMGKNEESIASNLAAEALVSFADKSSFAKDQFFAAIVAASQYLGKNDQAERYQQMRADPELVKEIHEANFLLEKQSNSLSKEKKKSAYAIAAADFFKRYSVGVTLLIFAVIPWFLLSMIQRRLLNAKLELQAERENIRKQKENYHDLANRFQRLQRMESLGLMAGHIAHDFNNILVGVLGNAEIIQMTSDPERDPQIHERVDSIIRSAERAAELSSQMLAYSGKQYVKKEHCDLNQVVTQLMPIFESTFQREPKIELELAENSIPVKIDVSQIEQVILNLVANAVSASNPNGRIQIRTGRTTVSDFDDDDSYFGPRRTGGDFGYVEVEDEGVGIASEDLGRIFEPFYSRSQEGQGLGLAVAYGVVSGHDGLVQCQSKPGESTTFRAMLPLEPCDQETSDSKETGESASRKICNFASAEGSNKTIVVIDDEESVRDLCNRVIGFQGFNAMTCGCGRSGLEKIIDFQNEIACIILDVVMPEMGANEVLTELENRGIDIPVILMSGFSDSSLEQLCKRPSVVQFVQKPFSTKELQRTIDLAVSISASQKSSVSP